MTSAQQEYPYTNDHYNSEGQREGLHVYEQEGKTAYQHAYKGGLLVEARDYRYHIDGKDTLLGQYKAGKPFEGYFVYKIDNDIPVVDFYVNGTIEYQYNVAMDFSKDYYSEAPVFVKTEYKNGKPWQGLAKKMDPIEEGGYLLSTEYYQAGLLSHVDLMLLAVHYAEILKMEFVPNGFKLYNISNGADKTQIAYTYVSGKGHVSLQVDTEQVYVFDLELQSMAQKPKMRPGLIIYYKKGDDLVYLQRYHRVLKEEKLHTHDSPLIKVFMALAATYPNTFKTSGQNNYKLLFAEEMPENSLAGIQIDVKGMYDYGVLIEKEAMKTYKYTRYEDKKILKQEKGLSRKALENALQEK